MNKKIKIDGPGGIWTRDLCRARAAIFQLIYRPFQASSTDNLALFIFYQIPAYDYDIKENF